MATVITDDGITQVKNLGWLIHRLGQEIPLYIEVKEYPAANDNISWDCMLYVGFRKKHTVFGTSFADRSVLWHWLNNRRALKGEAIIWFGEAVQLNKQEMPHAND